MQSSIKVLSYKPTLLPGGLLADFSKRALSEGFGGGLRTVRGADEAQARPNRRYWMWRDIKILEDHYPSATPVKELAQALDRSIGSIRAKARQLGLRRMFRYPSQIPEKVVDAQRLRLRRDLAGLNRDRSGLLNKTVSGRVIWTDEVVKYVGELWMRLYSPAAIGAILGLDGGVISTLANRVELPRRTQQQGRPVEFLEGVPAADPLEAPICVSVKSMMEPIKCIETHRIFYRHPSSRGIRLSKAGRAIRARQATGMMH